MYHERKLKSKTVQDILVRSAYKATVYIDAQKKGFALYRLCRELLFGEIKKTCFLSREYKHDGMLINGVQNGA